MRTEEIDYLDEARAGARRRLDECEREIKLTRDLDERRSDDETARRCRKLKRQTERYHELIMRLDDEAKRARRQRLAALRDTELPNLLRAAARLHRRARRLDAARDRAQDQYRGVRMRRLAMDREIRELCELLGEPSPGTAEPDEVRLDLGRFGTDGGD
jgi:hypothetical protein